MKRNSTGVRSSTHRLLLAISWGMYSEFVSHKLGLMLRCNFTKNFLLVQYPRHFMEKNFFMAKRKYVVLNSFGTIAKINHVKKEQSIYEIRSRFSIKSKQQSLTAYFQSSTTQNNRSSVIDNAELVHVNSNARV